MVTVLQSPAQSCCVEPTVGGHLIVGLFYIIEIIFLGLVQF